MESGVALSTSPKTAVVTGAGGFIAGQTVLLHLPGSGSESRMNLHLQPVDCCPVCNSGHFAFAGYADVWRCLSCSVYFRNPRPTAESIRRYYDQGLSYARMAERRELVAPNWQGRLDIVRRHMKGGKLLDVGTADGEFLGHAAAAGFNVVGNEISETGASIAAARGFHVIGSALHDAGFQPGSFDVVTFWHVFEHLEDPRETLTTARQLLAPDGILVLAVPNEIAAILMTRLGAIRFRMLAEDAARGDELHLLHFTPTTFKRGLISSGFEILEFGVDNATVGSSYRTLSARMAQKALNALTGWHFAPAMYLVARAKTRKWG